MERQSYWYPTIISVVNDGDSKVYIDDEGCEYISLHTTEIGAEQAALALRGQNFYNRVQHDGKIIFGVW